MIIASIKCKIYGVLSRQRCISCLKTCGVLPLMQRKSYVAPSYIAQPTTKAGHNTSSCLLLLLFCRKCGDNTFCYFITSEYCIFVAHMLKTSAEYNVHVRNKQTLSTTSLYVDFCVNSSRRRIVLKKSVIPSLVNH